MMHRSRRWVRYAATLALVVLLGLSVIGVRPAFADVDPAQAASLAQAVDSAIAVLVPNVFRNARATYLDGYGVVVTMEVALDTPRNPFSNSRSPADIRENALERTASIRQRAISLLGTEAARIEGLGPDEVVSIIVYVVNPNPVDLPDLPGQVVASVRKQDAMDLASGALGTQEFADRVHVRED